MPVTFTSTVNIKDWKALQELNRETLVNQADKFGATYFQIYRNLNDVSQMLIIAEFPDYDTLREMIKALNKQFETLLTGDLSDDRVWEKTEWEGIG
jgi:hypothetical protein